MIGIGRAPWPATTALLTLACGPTLPKPSDAGLGPSRGDTTEARAAVQGLGRREHLLFRPRGNPSELLGRAVSRTPDGGLTMADELAPGCHVDVRATPEQWTRSYQDSLKRVAGGGADFGDIAKLEAEFGREGRVEVNVRNTQRLDADPQGNCGDWIIISVRVGTGSRSINTRAHQRGSGHAGALGVGAQGAASEDHRQKISFSWDEPQAWMFAVGGSGHRRHLRFKAGMPTELTDGEAYRVTVRSNESIWLLVYYREDNGQIGKLLPNEDNPVVAVARNERRELPEFRAALNDPAHSAQEDMIVCGFDNPDYVADFAPPRGEPSPAQMREWHEGLSDKLKRIDRRHYTCQDIAYRIVPAASSATGAKSSP